MFKSVKDSEFIRGKIPMTKEEIRAITISKLGLEDGMQVADIGSGTGSLSIQIAMNIPNGLVHSIEIEKEGIELISSNMKKFKVSNINIINEYASKGLDKIDYLDRAFIGGSKGEMEIIFERLDKLLKSKSILVINTITLESLNEALNLFKKYNYTDIDIVNVNISKGKFIKDYTMMLSNNPVYILSGMKI